MKALCLKTQYPFEEGRLYKYVSHANKLFSIYPQGHKQLFDKIDSTIFGKCFKMEALTTPMHYYYIGPTLFTKYFRKFL